MLERRHPLSQDACRSFLPCSAHPNTLSSESQPTDWSSLLSAHVSSRRTRESPFLAKELAGALGSGLPEPLGGRRATGCGLQGVALRQKGLSLLGGKVRPCWGCRLAVLPGEDGARQDHMAPSPASHPPLPSSSSLSHRCNF